MFTCDLIIPLLKTKVNRKSSLQEQKRVDKVLEKTYYVLVRNREQTKERKEARWMERGILRTISGTVATRFHARRRLRVRGRIIS